MRKIPSLLLLLGNRKPALTCWVEECRKSGAIRAEWNRFFLEVLTKTNKKNQTKKTGKMWSWRENKSKSVCVV